MSVIAHGILFADEGLSPELRQLETFAEGVAHILTEDNLHNIAEEIMRPAYARSPRTRSDLDQLSAVFSILLDRVGSVMLDALGDRLSGIESRRVLQILGDTLQQLSEAICRSCESDPISVFRAALLAELEDEGF